MSGLPPLPDAIGYNEDQKKMVTCLALNNYGTRLLWGSNDSTVCKYNSNFPEMTWSYQWASEPSKGYAVRSLSWSPSSKRFLCVTRDPQAKILKSDSTIVGELALGNTTTSHLNETRGHTMGLTCGEWNPKYKEAILTSSRDGSLRLWDVNDLSRHKKIFQPKLAGEVMRGAVTTCAWHFEGNRFAGGTENGCIQIWGSEKGLKSVYCDEKAHTASITSVKFSPNGVHLWSRSFDGTLKVWDLRKNEILKTFDGLPNSVLQTNLAFSPDGKVIITGTSFENASRTGGSLHFFHSTELMSLREVEISPTCSVVQCAWHPRLNQIVATYGDSRQGGTCFLHASVTESVEPEPANTSQKRKRESSSVVTPPPRSRNVQDVDGIIRLKALWDGENVAIPKALSLDKIYDHVVTAFRRHGYEVGPFKAFSCEFPSAFNQYLGRRRSFEAQDVKRTKYPEGKRDDVDDEIEIQLLQFALKHEPPSPVLIIAGDRDYARIVRFLRKMGFVVILAYTNDAPEELRESTPFSVSWEKLINGEYEKEYITSLPIRYPPNDRILSPPLRVFGDQRRGSSLRVIWDYNSSPTDETTLSYVNLKRGIELAAESGGYNVKAIEVYGNSQNMGIEVYGNSQNRGMGFSSKRQTKLSGAGFVVRFLAKPLKKRKKTDHVERVYCDIFLNRLILKWGIEKEPPAAMLLISTDQRLQRAIRAMVELGFVIYLAYGEGADEALIAAATASIHFRRLQQGHWFPGL